MILAVTSALTPAVAQERVQHRTIFDLLFGTFRKPPPSQPTAPAQIRKKKNVVRKSQPAPSTADTANQALPAEKLPDAKRIIVIGDFMASSLADGLRDTFAPSAGVTVDTRINAASGLVRDDYYNWISALPQILEETKPAVLVVELGANDRQKMVVDGNREDFHTDKWTAEYEKRVTALTTLAVKQNIPILWTGVPSFQSPSLTADIVTLNLMVRRQVEAAGGTYVDIWDGFVDGDGKFSATGSDVDGQQARLRGSDGISLTKAGKAKMAFYVEKFARRILGDAATPAAVPPTTPDIATPGAASAVIAPKNTVVVRTDPIGMTDPSLDGGSALAPKPAENAADSHSPLDRLVLHGDPGAAPEGRVDDYHLRSD